MRVPHNRPLYVTFSSAKLLYAYQWNQTSKTRSINGIAFCYPYHSGITITATSREHHGVSKHRQLGYVCVFFGLTLNKISKLCITVSLWGKSTGDRWFPLKKGQERRKRHHGRVQSNVSTSNGNMYKGLSCFILLWCYLLVIHGFVWLINPCSSGIIHCTELISWLWSNPVGYG